MKNTAILFLLIAAMSSCGNAPESTEVKTVDTVAAAPPQEEKPPVVDSATGMKNWMEAMTPGPQHQAMAAQNGKWKTEMTMWMAEGAPPSTTVGTMENKMILGGRYQQSMFKADMNGMPFEGMAISGYDKTKKKVVNSWVDNMGTGILVLEGTYDEASKSTELKGTCVDAMTRWETGVREVMKTIDDKTMTMEMYMTPKGGEEYKSLEIKMTKM